ncbi:hypothetical protein [Saccharopolyspora spinosa]|uniref:hypothetical protein n=1 Tax=Saccharopolyspora spinosa TaxID=60894 RepID=UPI00376EC0A2
MAGRDKKVREVAETGVGGAPVADRSVGPEGVSGWTGADQVDRDGWSADVDVDAWLARAVADVDGVQVPQGAANAGVMLGGVLMRSLSRMSCSRSWDRMPGIMLRVSAMLGRLSVGLILPVSSPTTARGGFRWVVWE